jgi:hypothetical protein
MKAIKLVLFATLIARFCVTAWSPHALHIPSDIFATLGLWQEPIQSNLASAAAAKAYAAKRLSGQILWLHLDHFRIHALLQGA